MINYDNITKEIISKHNLNWPQIPDHPYRILTIGGSRSGKTNALLNSIMMIIALLIKTYLYVKKLYEAKYQYLIKNEKRWSWKSGRSQGFYWIFK